MNAESFQLDRDSRVVVYLSGGITGGLLEDPLDVSLEALSDESFRRVQEIVTALISGENVQREKSCLGDFGYYVKAGHKEAKGRELVTVFQGGPFSKTPLIVRELEEILEPLAPQRRPGLGTILKKMARDPS